MEMALVLRVVERIVAVPVVKAVVVVVVVPSVVFVKLHLEYEESRASFHGLARQF